MANARAPWRQIISPKSFHLSFTNQEDTSDAAYEKRHRKPENLEKRERRQEKEKLVRDRAKLKERIEHLKVIDARMLTPIITAREHNRFGAAAAAAAAASDTEGLSTASLSHQGGASPRGILDASTSASSSKPHQSHSSSITLVRLEALRKELLAEAFENLRRYDTLLSGKPMGAAQRKKSHLTFVDSGAEDSDAAPSPVPQSQSHSRPQQQSQPQVHAATSSLDAVSKPARPQGLSMTAGAIALRASRAAKKAARLAEEEGVGLDRSGSASSRSRHFATVSREVEEEEEEESSEDDGRAFRVIVPERIHPNIHARTSGGRFAKGSSSSGSSKTSTSGERERPPKPSFSSSSSSTANGGQEKSRPENAHANPNTGGNLPPRSSSISINSSTSNTGSPRIRIKPRRDPKEPKVPKERVPMAPGEKVRLENDYINIHARSSSGRFAPKAAVAHLSSSPPSSNRPSTSNGTSRRRPSNRSSGPPESNYPTLLPTHSSKIAPSLAEIDATERRPKRVKLILGARTEQDGPAPASLPFPISSSSRDMESDDEIDLDDIEDPGSFPTATIPVEQARELLHSAKVEAELGSQEAEGQMEALERALGPETGSAVNVEVPDTLLSLQVPPSSGISALASSSPIPQTSNPTPSLIPELQLSSNVNAPSSSTSQSLTSLPPSAASRRVSNRVKAISAFGERVPDWTTRLRDFDDAIDFDEPEWSGFKNSSAV